MRPARSQQGFTLVAVIFLVVVLGGAVTLIASLAAQSAGQYSQNLLQTQARLAAQAGIEWATQSLVTVSDAGRGNHCANNINSATVSVPAYNDYSVTLIRCVRRRYSNDNVILYDLTATAEYGQIDDPDYVWTELNATLEFDN